MIVMIKTIKVNMEVAAENPEIQRQGRVVLELRIRKKWQTMVNTVKSIFGQGDELFKICLNPAKIQKVNV